MKAVDYATNAVRFAADSVNVLLSYVDADLRYRYANKAYESWFGFPSTQIEGMTMEEVLGVECFKEVKPYVKRTLNGEAVSFESRVHYKHAGLRYISANYVPEFDANDHVFGFALYAADITEQKRNEEAQKFLFDADLVLSSSLDYEETLRRVAQVAAQSLADWVVVSLVEQTGENRRIALAHRDPKRVEWALQLEKKYPPRPKEDSADAQVLKSGKPFLISEIPEQLIAEAARDEEHYQLLKEAAARSAMVLPIKAGSEIIGTITYVSGEAGKYDQKSLDIAEEISSRASLALENAKLFNSAQQEIAERKQSEKAILESEAKYQTLAAELEQRVFRRTEQLEVANKELEAFSYSVSHDLRSPLRTISSFSQLLLLEQQDRLDEEGKDNLSRILDATKRMSRLIDDLLQYARLARQELVYGPVDLAQLAKDILSDLRLRDKNRLVGVKIAKSLPVVGDRNLLKTALENLLENAWKFSSKVEDPCIQVGTLDRDGEKVYFVKDNGAGFDMRYASKLFRPFERLHSEVDFPGSGIGLVNVQRIVARHGGRMWAEAALGKGATLFFTLPDRRTKAR